VLPVVGPLLVRSFNSRGKIGRVRAPLLFVHGDADRIVPIGLGKTLWTAAPEPKTFWTVPGAGHNDILEVAGGDYGERLREFYQRLN
jgi:fermentation-respiration switch protein FrsA (DUF1100 family)